MAKTKHKEPPELPPSPDFRRRVAFKPTQAIGVPLLLAIPLIGAFGFFDTDVAIASAELNGIGLEIEYWSRFRHRALQPLRIIVRNNTGQEQEKLQVKLNAKYLEAFENVDFLPEPKEIGDQQVVFEFEHVPAGETRSVEIEMEALHPGMKKAFVEANGTTLAFQTFVMP